MAVPVGGRQRVLDLHQELGVRLRLFELAEDHLELLLQFEPGQRAAQAPGDLDLFGAEQLLFAAVCMIVATLTREAPAPASAPTIESPSV